MQIGCHISIAKGFLHAAQEAKSLGAESFQVFTKNPRSLRPKQLNQEDAAAGRAFCEEHGLVVLTHTPYVSNLSTPKADLQEWTVRSLREDLLIASAYGAVGAVVHCGKHVGKGEESGRERMVETLNIILQESEGETPLLLENTAGQGTELGTQLEELVALRAATDFPARIGFCFDTCHAFAAGLWEGSSYQELMATMRTTGFLEHLRAVHFNDSQVPFGSRKDRHAKIGKGEIGAEALQNFLRDVAFARLPIVLETPVEDVQEYADEIKYLRTLL